MTAPSDGDAPAKGDGYRRKSHAGRYLRAQCGGLTPAQVRAWLTQFDPVVKLVVRNLHRKNPHATLELEDLLSVGQMAVLEACQTFKEGAGGTLRTWVGNVIRWRVAAAIEEVSETWVLNLDNFGPAYASKQHAKWAPRVRRYDAPDAAADGHDGAELYYVQVSRDGGRPDPFAQLEAREELADFIDRIDRGFDTSGQAAAFSADRLASVEEALLPLQAPFPPKVVKRPQTRLKRVG
jgi:hypothetical protein